MAAAQYYEQIQQAYLAYYGRPADPQGLVYWATQLDNAGGNLNAIINAFGTSAESESLYGSTPGAAQVAAIYQQLFGRAPDATGLTFYVNGLATGQFTLASIALNIYNGASGTDLTALQSKLAYADAFTNALESSVDGQIAYSGNAAAANARTAVSGVTDSASEATAAANISTTISNIGAGTVGQTYTLTTSVDTISLTGNNNVVNGIVGTNAQAPATFTAADSITAAANSTGNILDITDATGGQGVPTPVTVSGVQTVNWVSAGTVGQLDTTGFTGLTQLNVTEVGGDTSVTAAATTNVTLTDSNLNGASIDVEGGQNVAVTVSNANGGDIEVGTSATAPAGTVSVTENVAKSTTGAQINVNGGTTVTVTETLAKGATGGDVGVTGAAATTSVTVNQTAVSANGPAGNGTVTIADANGAGSTTLDSITTVALSNASGATITSNALANLTLAGAVGTVALDDAGLAAKSQVTTLTLNANATTAIVSDTDHNSTVGSGIYTTLNVVAGGAKASSITFNDAALTTLNVSGTQEVSIVDNATTLKTVAVSGSAGVEIALGTGTAFTSTSTGTDVVTISAATSKAIVGNGTAGEELVWNNTAPTETAGVQSFAATGGSVSGFTTLGVGAAGSGTFDLSAITGFTALDVQGGGFISGVATTDTHTVTFDNVAAGTALSIDSAIAGVTYQSADTNGSSDTLSLTLGSATASGNFTVGTLIAEDSNLTGFGTLSINAVNAAQASTLIDTISTLTDSNLAALNVSGTASVTIGAASISGNALTIDATAATNATGTSPDAAALTITSLTDTAAKFALTVDGSEAVSIGTLASSATGALAITSSDDAGLSIGTLTSAGATSITITNNSTATDGVVTVTNAVTDAAATKLALMGDVAIDFASGANASALTVNASTDNAAVTIDLSLSSENNVVTLGTGTDTVHLGSGADTVTFGAHTTTSTAYDELYLGLQTANNTASATQPSVLTTGFAVASGLVSGDVLNLSAITGQTSAALAATATVAQVTNLAGVANEVVEAHGTYSNGTFTYAANGNDTLLTVDTGTTGHAYQSIVLVGYHGTVAASTALVGSELHLA